MVSEVVSGIARGNDEGWRVEGEEGVKWRIDREIGMRAGRESPRVDIRVGLKVGRRPQAQAPALWKGAVWPSL